MEIVPPAVLERMNAAANKILRDPDVKKSLEGEGMGDQRIRREEILACAAWPMRRDGAADGQRFPCIKQSLDPGTEVTAPPNPRKS